MIKRDFDAHSSGIIMVDIPASCEVCHFNDNNIHCILLSEYDDDEPTINNCPIMNSTKFCLKISEFLGQRTKDEMKEFYETLPVILRENRKDRY